MAKGLWVGRGLDFWNFFNFVMPLSPGCDKNSRETFKKYAAENLHHGYLYLIIHSCIFNCKEFSRKKTIKVIKMTHVDSFF